MDLPIRTSFDEILSQLAWKGLPASSKKVLFWGEGAGEMSSYVAGWLVSEGIDVIVLDGANRFNPYVVSSFARKALISPERLLKRIRIARAFTCYQMATLMGERLPLLLREEKVALPMKKLWVILLEPITTFLDEDVPEREVWPLFEKSLKKVEGMAMEGIPFLIFQPNPSLAKGGAVTQNWGSGAKWEGRLRDSKRAYLAKRLFQFSDLVWRVDLADQGTKMILEKGIEMVSHCERSEATSRDCFVVPKLLDSSQ